MDNKYFDALSAKEKLESCGYILTAEQNLEEEKRIVFTDGDDLNNKIENPKMISFTIDIKNNEVYGYDITNTIDHIDIRLHKAIDAFINEYNII